MLPGILWAVTSATEDENHWILSLQCGELPAFRGVIGKLIVRKDSPWNNVRSHRKEEVDVSCWHINCPVAPYPSLSEKIMTQRIRGVLSPVVTPFRADFSPDKERLIAHCRWLLSQHCGLAVFGTTSEANSLAAEERSALLDALVAAGVDTSRMMPGTGCCSITETVKLTSQAVKHGCAGVLMLPPFYYKGVSEEGLYRCFSKVVQRVGDARLKIYLYHIPAVAVVGVTPGLVERLLAAYPDIIAGMKDSSGDWNNTKTFLDAFNGFDVFVGSESFLLAG